jgi:hypothetical protein
MIYRASKVFTCGGLRKMKTSVSEYDYSRDPVEDHSIIFVHTRWTRDAIAMHRRLGSHELVWRHADIATDLPQQKRRNIASGVHWGPWLRDRRHDRTAV